MRLAAPACIPGCKTLDTTGVESGLCLTPLVSIPEILTAYTADERFDPMTLRLP